MIADGHLIFLGVLYGLICSLYHPQGKFKLLHNIDWKLTVLLLIAGDTELVLGLDYYTCTVVCTAQTEVFILDNKNIERLIHKKNKHTLDLLRNEAEAKIQGRYNTQLGSHVELYQHLLVKLKELRPKTYQSSYRREVEKSENELKAQDRDVMLNQLVKLFIQDRSPMIEPSVPGTVFYMTKAVDRARRQLTVQTQRKKHNMATRATSADVRLQRARKAGRRHPRSRRELERLTIAKDTEGITPLQDRNSAVNRFLSKTMDPSSQQHHHQHHQQNTTSPYSHGTSQESTEWKRWGDFPFNRARPSNIKRSGRPSHSGTK